MVPRRTHKIDAGCAGGAKLDHADKLRREETISRGGLNHHCRAGSPTIQKIIYRYRWLLTLAALTIAALACALPGIFSPGASSEASDIPGAQQIYDEAGITVDEALAAPMEDQRKGVLDSLGPPDAFTLEWQELNGKSVRWEEWSYFDFKSRFDFVDGELLWTLEIPAAPDGSVYAHAFDPLAFEAGMSVAQVKSLFPDLAFMDVPLAEADIPAGVVLATDQLLLGFDQDQLVYVQTFILSPSDLLASEANPVPPTQAAAVPATQGAPVMPTAGAASAPLLVDTFDDPGRSATPLFGPETMEFSLYDGIGSLIAHKPGVLVALYDTPQATDFQATAKLWAPDPQPGAGYGLLFRSDDRAGGLAYYYMVLIQPADGIVVLDRWDAGKMTEVARRPLPDLGDGRLQLRLRVRGSDISVDINGAQVMQAQDSALPLPGLIGLVIQSPKDPDSVLFDELRVEMLSE